jgi:hypothetical protein
MMPLPAPNVPGETEAARMENAVRMLFSASKTEFIKQETKQKTARSRRDQRKATK